MLRRKVLSAGARVGLKDDEINQIGTVFTTSLKIEKCKMVIIGSKGCAKGDFDSNFMG